MPERREDQSQSCLYQFAYQIPTCHQEIFTTQTSTEEGNTHLWAIVRFIGLEYGIYNFLEFLEAIGVTGEYLENRKKG